MSWRLYSKQRIKKLINNKTTQKKYRYPGEDSSFYQLVDVLESKGFIRRVGETMNDWINRIEQKLSNQYLKPALRLHYKYRFDPNGLAQQARIDLKNMVEKAVESITQTTHKA